jgi:uncharacterized phage protein (TIGR02216 family)
MGIGFSVLRLSPETLWRMTPREFRAALRPHGAAGGPSRAGLQALMAAHPDKEAGDVGL